jgi:hypothetical protein
LELKWSKKSILILDDLDRIDPEHIFRIMNVFWAHFNLEHKTDVNKFWFDKIILVWDYDNLKSIFHHKYWDETDFNGYINKFFSSEIYFFDNSKMVKSLVQDIIHNIKIWSPQLKNAMWDSWFIELILKEVLEQSTILKTKNKLSLRELMKWVKYELEPLNERNIGNLWERDTYFIVGIKILLIICGGKKEYLIDTLKDIQEAYVVPESLYRSQSYKFVILDLIHQMYTVKNVYATVDKTLTNKYNHSEFIDDNGMLGIWSINNKQLINLFYRVIIDYVETKID